MEPPLSDDTEIPQALSGTWKRLLLTAVLSAPPVGFVCAVLAALPRVSRDTATWADLQRTATYGVVVGVPAGFAFGLLAFLVALLFPEPDGEPAGWVPIALAGGALCGSAIAAFSPSGHPTPVLALVILGMIAGMALGVRARSTSYGPRNAAFLLVLLGGIGVLGRLVPVLLDVAG